MSVPEGQRGKGKFTVLTKANMLSIYTVKICCNKKVFIPEYQHALTDDIIRTAKDIFIHCWTANNIRVGKDEEKRKERRRVIRIIDPNNVKQERKKLRRMVGLVKKGKMTRKKVDECFKAWKAHAEKGNSTKLINRMNKYYADLWKEEQEHEHDQEKKNCERTEKHGGHAGTAGKTAGDT